MSPHGPWLLVFNVAQNNLTLHNKHANGCHIFHVWLKARRWKKLCFFGDFFVSLRSEEPPGSADDTGPDWISAADCCHQWFPWEERNDSSRNYGEWPWRELSSRTSYSRGWKQGMTKSSLKKEERKLTKMIFSTHTITDNLFLVLFYSNVLEWFKCVIQCCILIRFLAVYLGAFFDPIINSVFYFENHLLCFCQSLGGCSHFYWSRNFDFLNS